MIQSLSLAFGDLMAPSMRRYVWISIGAAVAILAGLWWVVWLLLSETAFTALPWLEIAFDVLGGFAVLVLSFLFFPGVVGVIAGLLLDAVAGDVERRHYPTLQGRPIGVAETVWMAAKFAGIVVLANLLVLPLYLIPLVNVVVFYGVNGYLLGREYFELAGSRRWPPADMTARRRGRRGTWLIAGLMIAVLMSIPVVNWIAPIVATAFMVHLLARKEGQETV